jgi:hypothetical protein
MIRAQRPESLGTLIESTRLYSGFADAGKLGSYLWSSVSYKCSSIKPGKASVMVSTGSKQPYHNICGQTLVRLRLLRSVQGAYMPEVGDKKRGPTQFASKSLGE